MHMAYLLGMRRYISPRLTVDAFTLSPFNTVCGDGAVDIIILSSLLLRIMMGFGLPAPSGSNCDV